MSGGMLNITTILKILYLISKNKKKKGKIPHLNSRLKQLGISNEGRLTSGIFSVRRSFAKLFLKDSIESQFL